MTAQEALTVIMTAASKGSYTLEEGNRVNTALAVCSQITFSEPEQAAPENKDEPKKGK